MTRLCSLLLLVVCISFSICIGIVYGQDAFIDAGGATIKGEVIDTSPEQKPIEGVTVKIVNAATEEVFTLTTDKDGFYEKKGLPAGRYIINISKNGYGDRVGKSKVVAAGGEIFDRIKMRKMDNILTFFQRQPLFWLLAAGITVVIIIALVLLFIDLR